MGESTITSAPAGRNACAMRATVTRTIVGIVEAGVADHDIVRRGRQRRLFQITQNGLETARLPGRARRIVPQPRGRKEPSCTQPEVNVGTQIDRQDGMPQRCEPVAEPGEACTEIGDRQRAVPSSVSNLASAAQLSRRTVQ